MKIRRLIVLIFSFVLLLLGSSCGKTKVGLEEVERSKMDEMFYSLFSGYDINKISEDLNLITDIDGYTVTYHSNNPDVISDDGKIYQGIDSKKATFSATITSPNIDLSLTKTFVFTITAVAPIPIRELYNASGVYKVKGIVSAIYRNTIYLEDSTGKTKITLTKNYLEKIKEGSEVLITFDDSTEEKIVRFEVVSDDNAISKSAFLSELSEVDRNYYRRVTLNELKVQDVMLDPTNLYSDVVLTVTDGKISRTLLVNGESPYLDNETRLLFTDLENGDVITIKNVIFDDEFLYVYESEVIRTKQIEINYTNIIDVDKEGIVHIKGRVEYILLNSFIIKDETGSKLIKNPMDLPVEVGKTYAFTLDATFNGTLDLSVRRVKDNDYQIETDSNPIFVTNELLELLKENPLENYIYVEMIGEIAIVDDQKALIPFESVGTYVFFNKGVDDAFVGENVSVIGYMTDVSDNINMILDKIDLAENAKIRPIRVEIDAATDELSLYDSVDLFATIFPYYANTNNEITWSIDRSDVITITKDGKVRAIGFGKVTVTVGTKNNVFDQFVINVANIDNDKLAYYLFGKSEILVTVLDEIRFLPTNLEHTYTYSFDESLISIEGGRLRALDLGETEILVTVDGREDLTIKVIVDRDKNSGYDVVPEMIGKDVINVTSKEEFNEVLLSSYLSRYLSVNIRFNFDVESNNPVDLIDPRIYEVMLVSFNTYYIENGHTVTATFTALDGLRATIETGYASDNRGMLLYINDLLKNYGIYSKKRTSDFEQFKLYEVGTITMDVKNCQELFVAIEKGYIPNFNLSYSRCEHVFNLAKDILRNIIIDDMSDIEKVKAIYDYMVLNVTLDKVATNSSEKNLIANDLEGAFRGCASEEGIAKMFVVLCGIEGIRAKLVKGTNQSNKKYWNYVELNGINYLVSIPNAITLSLVDSNLGKLYSKSVSYINYDFFLKDTNILRRLYPNIQTFGEIQDSEMLNFLKEEMIYSSDIDFEINSQSELDYLFSLIKSFGFKNDYYVYFASKNFMITKEKIQAAINASGIKDDFLLVDFSVDNNKLYGVFVNVFEK